MSKGPKKGFFSFGKKNKEQQEAKAPGEKKGFFSRFKKKDDAPQAPEETLTQTPEPVAAPVAEVSQPAPPEEVATPVEAAPEAPVTVETPQEKELLPVQIQETPAQQETEAPAKVGFFAKLKAGLKKTRSSLSGLGAVFIRSRKIDEDLLEEIEEMLIGSDIGVQTSLDIIEKVRKEVDRKTLNNGEELKQHIQKELLNILNSIPDKGFQLDKAPTILLVVGVNGVGKTTTIGKVAKLMQSQGKKVCVCAADTFRAAAVEQLAIWANRAGVDIVLKEGSTDPAAVVFDALERVKETGADVLLIDTAGRLHNNPNLMSELNKIYRIIGRSFESAPHHVLLILDAVTGQNGLMQAREFVSKVGVTDLIITKLDGTAKGGIAIAIAKELNLPIQYIGVGEQMDDLLPFDADNFVHSLFED